MSTDERPADTGDMDAETAQTALSNCMRLWFDPEYERRVAAGQMAAGTLVIAAQAVFEGGQTTIRFNDEVRGHGFARARRAVQDGEPVKHEDLADIQSWDLAPDEIDYGHVSIFKIAGGWRCFFNFMQGRARAGALTVRAEKFLNVARHAHENGWHDVVIDTLFSACELLAKANLIVHMQKGSESKSHDVVSSEINKWRKLGNVEPDFVKLFNKLGNLRHLARYEVGDVSQLAQPSSALDIVAAQVAGLSEICDHEPRVKPRKPVSVMAILSDQSK